LKLDKTLSSHLYSYSKHLSLSFLMLEQRQINKIILSILKIFNDLLVVVVFVVVVLLVVIEVTVVVIVVDDIVVLVVATLLKKTVVFKYVIMI
jgi:hypothetical protein